MITVSLDGLFAPALTGGPAPDTLVDLAPDLAHARAELISARRSELGLAEPEALPEQLNSIRTEAKRLRALADDLLILGMGGSSLGGQTLTYALQHTSDREVRLHYIDNIDPDRINFLLGRLDPNRTAVLATSKSGETIETVAQLLIVRRWFRASVGQGESRSRMVFVTDPEVGLLRDLAGREGIRSFEIPKQVEGRYAALTPMGLLPAAFLNIDIEKICAGAATMMTRIITQSAESWENPAASLAAGALLAQRQLGRSIILMLPYSDALRSFSNWFVQLWAQSLGQGQDNEGKAMGVVQTPIAGVGTCDQYTQFQLLLRGPPDKVVLLVSPQRASQPLPIPDELEDQEAVAYLHGHDLNEVLAAQRRATRASLLQAGVPVIEINLPGVDEGHVGGLVVLAQAACAMAGLASQIDPFAPAVFGGQRRIARALLDPEPKSEEPQRVLARKARTDTV